jgi:endoglucanase
MPKTSLFRSGFRSSLVGRATLTLGAASVWLGGAANAFAQAPVAGLAGAIPFPSTNAGANGFTTKVLTTHELRGLYDFWRTNFIERCNGTNDARVVYRENNPQDTRSEGIGYGMVIAAYMGDRATLDGLWGYYQRASTGGLMNWKRDNCAQNGGGGGNDGSAADADVDAALALIVADKQFPGQGYAADAQTLIAAIRTRLVNTGRQCDGLLLPGSNYAGCGCVNPSYIPPGYYLAYGSIENQQAWTAARNTSYTLFAAAQNDTTGLVPAWSSSTGSTQLNNCQFSVTGGGNSDEFQADAARTPWRVATDYLWTGEPRAQQFLGTLATYAATNLPLVRTVDRYSLQGAPLGDNTATAEGRRSTFMMGGLASAMTARSQADLDRFVAAWQSIYKPGDNAAANETTTPRFYGNSLALLYGLLVTGTMWNPLAAAAPVVEPALADQAGNLFTNGDFDAGLLGWTGVSLAGAGGEDADGYAQHVDGKIHFVTLKDQPDRAYALQLRQDVPLRQGQNYALTFRASAAAARPLRVSIGEVLDRGNNNGTTYETYVSATDGAGVMGADGERAPTFNVTTTDTAYRFVFQSPITDNGARFSFQFGDSNEEVVLDDVLLVTTTDPVTELIAPVGAPPVQPPPAGTGGEPAPAPGGSGGTPPPSGTLGNVGSGQGDVSSNPGSSQSPLPNPAPGGGVAIGTIPQVAPPLNAASPSQANCAPLAYSAVLNLCYDVGTGLVWDASRNSLTAPPPAPAAWCGSQIGKTFYWWPKAELSGGACYDPDSGYAWSAQQNAWVAVGKNFELGEGLGSSDSGGCAVSPVRAANSAWSLGALGLALGALARRRARRS